MPPRLSQTSLALLLLLSFTSCALARDQDLNPEDRRLDTTVTVWEEKISAGELLARLSQQYALSLTASDGVAPLRVTVYSQERPLHDLLLGLAEVCRARWERASTGYHLVGLQPPLPSRDFNQLLLDRRRLAAVGENKRLRPARAERLARYREALTLSREALLEQYEATDPWACADLLSPRQAPMIAQICALPGRDLDKLLAEGTLILPLSRFPVAFQRHLAVWVTDRQRAPTGMDYGVNVDRLPRFVTPEERWQGSSVLLWWSERSLQLRLSVPDVFEFETEVIHTLATPPLRARQRLVALDPTKNTPEYRQTAEKEQADWVAANPQSARNEPSQRLGYADLLPPPAEEDPRSRATVKLELGATSHPSAPYLLEQIARQGEMGVIANYLPEGLFKAHLQDLSTGEGTETVGSLLSSIRAGRRGGWTWSFQGEFLVALDANYELVEGAQVPEATSAALRAKCASSPTLPLSELASLVRGLNLMQLDQLVRESSQLEEALTSDIGIYAELVPEQQPALSSPEGLSFLGLTPPQRAEILRIAQRLRPWLTEADLSNTLLRTLPRRLATGEEGVSLIIEYHFLDSPNDRDVVFTLPLQIPLRPGAEG